MPLTIPFLRFTQCPSLERLIAFERVSWPEDEQASPAQLADRLRSFPDGIFMLSAGGKDIAQFTCAPKSLGDLSQISSFAQGRDLGVDLESKDLWGMNLVVRPEYQGMGYAPLILEHALRWAVDQGYRSLSGGGTCSGYAQLLREGTVSSITVYAQQGLNPVVRTFKKAAKNLGHSFESFDPIKNYWPEDVGSAGYGVMMRITFANQKHN